MDIRFTKPFAPKSLTGKIRNAYLQILQTIKAVFSSRKQPVYLEALSPEQVRSRLEAMGLRKDWVFADFDEVITCQSSQQLWAKKIAKNKKEVFPSIFWKYLHHYKWKENLYELNKIFQYSDGLKELESDVIPLLKFNENAEKALNDLKNKEIAAPTDLFRKLIHRFFRPSLNLVIVSSNTGALIRRFLEREDIRKRLRENRIMVRVVVANKMGLDTKGHVTGLSHKENIIDIHTKKDYIPKNNPVLVDKRDSRLNQSHPNVILVPSDQPNNRIDELRLLMKRFPILNRQNRHPFQGLTK